MISIGAATLADIFEPAVRGRKVGITGLDTIMITTDFILKDGDLFLFTTAWTGIHLPSTV